MLSLTLHIKLLLISCLLSPNRLVDADPSQSLNSNLGSREIRESSNEKMHWLTMVIHFLLSELYWSSIGMSWCSNFKKLDNQSFFVEPDQLLISSHSLIVQIICLDWIVECVQWIVDLENLLFLFHAQSLKLLSSSRTSGLLNPKTCPILKREIWR